MSKKALSKKDRERRAIEESTPQVKASRSLDVSNPLEGPFWLRAGKPDPQRCRQCEHQKRCEELGISSCTDNNGLSARRAKPASTNLGEVLFAALCRDK